MVFQCHPYQKQAARQENCQVGKEVGFSGPSGPVSFYISLSTFCTLPKNLTIGPKLRNASNVPYNLNFWYGINVALNAIIVPCRIYKNIGIDFAGTASNVPKSL